MVKKVSIFGLIFLLLLTCTTVFAQENPRDKLQNWSTNLLSSYPSKLLELLAETNLLSEIDLEQINELASNEMDQFHSSIISSRKQDVENYQRNYYQRLIETKANLLEVDFEEYSKLKQEELENEITTEIEDFLHDLLVEQK
ncbi:hypothetical protein [Ornithinibacillus halotolerans]|uniref:Uncharacterized protein n=1 Tax=Ornithinibacillus halotolerans TaxID=1274357 RepID=A0A916W950_9BACI|nr:hypothetical protein [Ornithinibacillus halotolerans]GGA79264.1 hypothetical protein GCM10008025_23350 [Ornithinibacillus halotolerans]